jgi:hypothetical protein
VVDQLMRPWLFLLAIEAPCVALGVVLQPSVPCILPRAYAGWPSSGSPYLGIPGPPSLCPDNDGSSGASAGTPNFPTLLTGGNFLGVTYAATINGAHGLGCKVAGVDYVVGLPPGTTLADPTTAGLPSGCTYDGSQYVHCSGTGTVSGYDFSLHTPSLLTTSGTWTVTDNKFALGANCTDPVINASGSLTLVYNTIDGTPGFHCSLSQGFGTMVNVNIASGGSYLSEYNLYIEVPQDGNDMNAPSSGTGSTTIKYNLLDLEGSTGHPDWVQYCGGGAGILENNAIEHNTIYTYTFSGAIGAFQPLHVEAQTCSGLGHLLNSSVLYNTVITQGACDGGADYPTNCSANYDIACKRDDTSTNANFVASGNYVDWSGAIAALTNGYGCPTTTWGAPYDNYDMTAGVPLTEP